MNSKSTTVTNKSSTTKDVSKKEQGIDNSSRTKMNSKSSTTTKKSSITKDVNKKEQGIDNSSTTKMNNKSPTATKKSSITKDVNKKEQGIDNSSTTKMNNKSPTATKKLSITKDVSKKEQGINKSSMIKMNSKSPATKKSSITRDISKEQSYPVIKREENFIDYNKYNGRKKYFKISTVTDSFGTPLSSSIISSKQSDNISINETINNIPVDLNTLKNSKNNRYKQYLLADSGYHSQNNINYLKKIGYTPIIAYNKRNCKSRKTIEKNKLRGKEAKNI
jgi:hypothetical protein